MLKTFWLDIFQEFWSPSSEQGTHKTARFLERVVIMGDCNNGDEYDKDGMDFDSLTTTK